MAAKRKLLRRKTSNWPVMLSVSVLVLLVGLGASFFFITEKIVNQVKSDIQITVFLEPRVEASQADSIRAEWLSKGTIHKIDMVTKEVGAKNLSADLGEDFIQVLGENPLPIILEVYPTTTQYNENKVKGMELMLRSWDGVESVQSSMDIVRAINKLQNAVFVGILTFVLFLFLIAYIIINNTVKLSVYANRFVIKNMQLIGATEGFIIKPFVKRMAKVGLYGGIVSSVLLTAIILFGFPFLAQKTEVISLNFQDFVQSKTDLIKYSTLFALNPLIGIIVSATAAYYATKRYLRSRIEELY